MGEYHQMTKSRLSRTFALIILPLAASFKDFLRAAAVTATNTVTFAETLCAGPCSVLDSVLTGACPGVSSDSFFDFIPCGCTNDLSTAWEGCSRCLVMNAENRTEFTITKSNDQEGFEALQAACAKTGKPIKDIDISNVPFSDSPAYFTYERPQSMSDKSFPNYIAAVCQKPDMITSDQCWVGDTNWLTCPNSDVAGILVRVSAYMANLLLGIVLMYSPEEAATTVWAQLLTIYSLLASGIVAIAHGDLSRSHAEILVMLVMSPLSSALVVYAILGFCGRSHRLNPILSKGREHLLTRAIVTIYAIASLAIVLFNGIANDSHFSPTPCVLMPKGFHAIWRNLLFIPYAGVLLVIFIVLSHPTSFANDLIGFLIIMAPFILVVLCLVFAILRRRHMISKQCQLQTNRWRIWVMWDVLAVEYPLLHFCGVFFIPMVYWILVVEVNVVGTPDNLLSTSFGQMLAIFVVLPPLLQVVKMTPMAWGWFRNLTPIRLVFGAPNSAPPANVRYSIEAPTPKINRLGDSAAYFTVEYHQMQGSPGPYHAHGISGRI